MPDGLLRPLQRRWQHLPQLPGASWRGVAVAALGALTGILLTGALTAALLGRDWHLPVLMAPLAATSVIVYVLPASPLGRPWAVIVGHVISALVGVLVARWLADPLLAAGVAVAAAIVAMAATRSLHPPGGATALVAVIGGAAVQSAGFSYAAVPVGLNAVLLTVLAVLFHRFISGHPYPHVSATTKPPPAESMALDITEADIDAAVQRYGEVLDVERSDVEMLVREVERAALKRRQQGGISA